MKEELINGNYDVEIPDEGATGTEAEIISSDTEVVKEPFNTSGIRVSAKPTNLNALTKRIEHKEIDLTPDFQRHFIWNDTAQSRLVESMMMKFPIPGFYIDATNENKWIVVDGSQRLNTIKRFVIDNQLKLTNLEFLTQYDGSSFSTLPRDMQRRIDETEFTLFLLEEGTPDAAKFNIFKRINTGGMPLSAQEIRHALNQGRATVFLKEIAESELFKKATDNGIKDARMADRECVLRFIAFYINPPEVYDFRDYENLDIFLNMVMAGVNKMTDHKLEELKEHFNRSMTAAIKIFGREAFRKKLRKGAPRNPINKALFETWSVNLSKLKDDEIDKLHKLKESLTEPFIKIMSVNEKIFSIGTGEPSRIKLRFKLINDLIRNTLKEHID